MNRKIICTQCGTVIKEEGEPCPACGSEYYTVQLSFEDSIALQDKARIRVTADKKHGREKIRREINTGASFSKQRKKFVNRIVDVNREDDIYTELVQDNENKEVIHYCNEKLSEHIGHGSAKVKK